MSIYVMTGKLGNGKSLLAVSRIRDYLRQGRRIATNLDLWPENMLKPRDRSARIIRLPDKPTASDLEAIGLGADELDEERYGLLVLDELGSWLNARTYADKERAGLIDWLIHSRKRRWDIIFLVQSLGMLDKQVREALVEYLVTCKRLDRIRIPIFGMLGKVLSLGAWDGRMGRIHMGVVTYAAGAAMQSQAIVTDRWIYRGNSLFDAYDTEQKFLSTYEHGVFSYLTPWHVKGRYMDKTKWEIILERVKGAVGYGPVPRRSYAHLEKPARLATLTKLPAEVRWVATRRLVAGGYL